MVPPVIIFYSIVSVIFLGMNYLFLSRMFSYFGFSYPFIWSIVAVVFFFVSNTLQESLNNGFSFLLHKIAGLWLGIVWIGLFVVLVIELLKLTKAPLPWGYIAVGILIVLTGLGMYFASSWVTFEHTITTDKITEPVRIVHLTDQHLHGVDAKNEFDKVIEKVKPLEPDVVVITGDLFDAPGRAKDDAFASLQTLKVPVLFVTGNHEFYVDVRWTEEVMTTLGAEVLRTRTTMVKGIQFTGVDDPTSRRALAEELEKVKLEDTFKVLLYHQPDPVQPAVDKGFDLMLSGHTHAGQIYPFNLLVMSRFKYWKGLYKIGDMELYVNPGTGTWMVPMRLGSRNTIGVIDVKPSSS